MRTRKGRSAEEIGEGSRVGTTLHLNGMGVAHTHTYIYTYAAKLILQLHFRIGAEKD